MGRRKSKRKPPPKKKMTGTLETQFTCPFCNHEKSCDVKMDRARNTGVISCTVCLEEFQTPITSSAHPLLSVMSWVLRLACHQKKERGPEVPAFGRWPGGACGQPFTPPSILFSQ
ncbi:PREDICTED: transcription elongation factor 1 homolog isoform X1 [Mandrillus leucophaeus]|uniref:Transcription elongation factor 1 homolog n=1 Tax=Mandrillus leucophaeus TaxID=9568 RepID=A0A2K5ZUS3_MANLE|nr:PREDICTED: transcription elongation factor 1 homolog isoform X1 [Mandrillus leucophaeus]